LFFRSLHVALMAAPDCTKWNRAITQKFRGMKHGRKNGRQELAFLQGTSLSLF